MATMAYRVVSTVPGHEDVPIEVLPSVVGVEHVWSAKSAARFARTNVRVREGVTHTILRRRADTPQQPWKLYQSYVMGADGIVRRTDR